jgi:peptidoglycan hydrolase CwlO-like protein
MAHAGRRKLIVVEFLNLFVMEVDKMRYIEKNEIRVKNLLSDIYQSESNVLRESKNVQQNTNSRINGLDREYNALINKQKELEEKFDKLQKAGADDSKWEKAKTEFELAIRFVEGDKESFLLKAERSIQRLSARISELESRIGKTSKEISENLKNRANDLKSSRTEIQNRIDEIKNDSGVKWKEIKLWFLTTTSKLEDEIKNAGSGL